jgi:hypothetical protein
MRIEKREMSCEMRIERRERSCEMRIVRGHEEGKDRKRIERGWTESKKWIRR